MKKILVDAYGGDNSPSEIVKGAIDAVNEKEGFTLVLVGKKEGIIEELKNLSYPKDRVEILPASEVITCEEEPTLAIRRKPDSSICVAFKTLKEDDDAKAFVSAGSTGAVLVGATLKLGRINGVNRPALCPILPTGKDGKKVFLLDAGANADCKSINLCQFALMGSEYAKICGVKNPKVALLCNGTEDEKGNALCHETFPLLKEMKGIDFVGNCEARDILSGEYDVVVADGFAGNIALKSIEGAIMLFSAELKKNIKASFLSMMGGLLLKGVFKKIKKKIDYSSAGGALFIGVKKPVIKAHGSSKAKAIKAAVLQAEGFADSGISESIEKGLSEITATENAQ